MKLIRLLTLSQLSVYRSRMTLAFCSMLACVCLVVWLVGSFESLRGEFDDKAEQYMGNYNLYLSPKGRNVDQLPDSLLQELASCPEVSHLEPASQTRVITSIAAKRYREGDQPMRDRMGIPSLSPILVGSRIIHTPYELEEGTWPDMSTTTEAVGVLGTGSAKTMGVGVNETLMVFTEAGVFPIKIVGLVEQSEGTPDISSNLSSGLGPAFASLFVPLSVYEKITGLPAKTNLAGIRLSSAVKETDFKKQLQDKINSQSLQVGIADADSLQFRLNDNRKVRGSKSQAYSAAGMVLLCCIFIIFTTLNMGVNERVRQLALLRAIGLTRRQVATQIICESFLLSIPAWLGGILLGYGLLAALHHLLPGEYPYAPKITGLTFLFSGICALGGGLLAAIIPAWRAARVSPLEAIQEPVEKAPGSRRFPWVSFILGILLLCVSPIILQVPGLEPEFRKDLYFTAGYLSLFVGIICLAPGLIHITELLFSPLLSALLNVQPKFLSYQLTRQTSRTVGTAVSLSIGLGLFVAVQCWGYSMLVPFKPTNSIPDVLVSFLPTGIPDSEWDKVFHTQGVKPDETLPIALEQTKLAPEQKTPQTFSLIQQDNVLIAGVDIQEAFEGSSPLLHFRFISGEQKEAVRKLKQGRHVLIPEGLSIATGLDVGDKINVLPPRHPDQPISYEIAGVIDFPGWHWLTKTSGMRRQTGGFTAGLLITDFPTARKDYELGNLQFFWMNVEPGTDLRSGNTSRNQDQGTSGRPQRGKGGLGPPSQSGSLEKAMQAIAEQNSGQELEIAHLTGVKAERPYVKISSTSVLNKVLQSRADMVITEMSKLPLIGLALATLALVNTLMASVRVRSREFGILRALGVTRSGLFRLILGEALLIGVSALILSLGFGLVAAWGSINLSRFGYVFGGIVPSLVIPWKHLAIGFGMALGFCLLAALWPAVRLARKQPLDLLNSGDRDS